MLLIFCCALMLTPVVGGIIMGLLEPLDDGWPPKKHPTKKGGR